MIGTIQQTKKSNTGKTLGVLVDGSWYTSKNWELEQEVNRRIIFDPSTQNIPGGGSIQWLNDYVFEDQSATPSGQAMDQAMANQPRRQPDQLKPNPVKPNKESLIGALALTKSITVGPEHREQVWSAFVYFYHKMEHFDPTAPSYTESS